MSKTIFNQYKNIYLPSLADGFFVVFVGRVVESSNRQVFDQKKSKPQLARLDEVHQLLDTACEVVEPNKCK